MTMNDNQLNRLASGRRFIHLCMFGWLCMFAFQLHNTPLLIPLLLVLGGAAMDGSNRVTRALGFAKAVSVASALVSVVPLLGLLVMGWLSFKTRRELLMAGWRLGMFHAYRPSQGGTPTNSPVEPNG